MGKGEHVISSSSFLAAAGALAFAVGGGSAHAADQVSLTIGKLLELTGPLSETGPSQDKAISIAIDYANQAAAAAGVPIKATAVAADAQGDSQAALSAARALVAKGASAIIGPEDHSGIHRHRQRPDHPEEDHLWPTRHQPCACARSRTRARFSAPCRLTACKLMRSPTPWPTRSAIPKQAALDRLPQRALR